MIADRVLIFSLSRSGSSTLMKMLDCHPQIECAFEPFNPATRLGKKFGRQIDNEAALKRAVAAVWKNYNGIKHVWNCNGVPFGVEPERQRLNDHLLAIAEAKVIFLKRRNILRRIVSGEISHQSGQWTSDTRARRLIRRGKYEPLDVSWLQWQMDREPAAIDRCREHLVNGKIPFIDVWYEDLFGEWDPAPGAEAKLEEIVAFLGLAPLAPRIHSRMLRLLDPVGRRVNSPATYERIPNIEEVERRLGTDETGWLFR